MYLVLYVYIGKKIALSKSTQIIGDACTRNPSKPRLIKTQLNKSNFTHQKIYNKFYVDFSRRNQSIKKTWFLSFSFVKWRMLVMSVVQCY